MAHKKWKPFEDFFGDIHLISSYNGSELAADVSEDDKTVYVSIHVAGIDPDKIDISVEDNVLHVSGEREEEKESADRHYIRKEIRRGSFERIISLPCAVDETKATAEIKDGVLRIAIPKKEESSRKKINIKR